MAMNPLGPGPKSIGVVREITPHGKDITTISAEGNDFGEGKYVSELTDETFILKGGGNFGAINLGDGENVVILDQNQGSKDAPLRFIGSDATDTVKFPKPRENYDFKSSPNTKQIFVREKNAPGKGQLFKNFDQFQFSNLMYKVTEKGVLGNTPELVIEPGDKVAQPNPKVRR